MRISPLRAFAPLLTSLLLVALLAPSALAQRSMGRLPREVLRANEELDAKYLEAHRQADTKMIMSLFSHGPDVFMIGPTGVIYQGREAVRRSVETFFAKVETMPGVIDRITYQRAGDGIIAYGQVTYHRKLRGQKPDTTVVVWSDYRRKERGRWVIVSRHAQWSLAGNRERYRRLAAKGD
jgi:ketosteroid isomerase-like protein